MRCAAEVTRSSTIIAGMRDVSVQMAVQARALVHPIMQRVQNMSVVISFSSEHIGGMWIGTIQAHGPPSYRGSTHHGFTESMRIFFPSGV
jgi:hypothetical protein